MMTKNIKHIFSAGLVGCALATALVACGDKEAPIADLQSAICPSTIEFNLPDNLRQLIYTDETGARVLPLIKGEHVSLPYTVTPDNITFNKVVWTSSNPEIASVDDQGNVDALSGDGIGYSIVQVAPLGMFSGSGVNCNLKVRVSNSLIKAQSCTVTVSGTEVYAGETLQATVSILPEEATYRTVKWSSSNEAAATVDENGVITGQKTSAMRTPVTITATTLDGSNVIGTAEIVVLQIIQPQSISIDQKYAAPGYDCAINKKSLELAYTTVPAECT
ncbi:MAG: Ig domain-containing protein, partial [Prevotella sp.]|nr:Ig domain-containing protein [Prevotella sp.]